MTKKMQKITELSEPPIVGKTYLVPTIEWKWCSRPVKVWPIFLPLHDDIEFLNFPYPHYHVDARFLSKSDFRIHGFGDSQFRPIARRPNPESEQWNRDPGTPVWRRRKCLRSEYLYCHSDKPEIQKMRKHFDGHKALPNRHGWVCPHRNFPLGSIGPDAEGVITCPLHGLRIRAADGVCLRAV